MINKNSCWYQNRKTGVNRRSWTSGLEQQRKTCWKENAGRDNGKKSTEDRTNKAKIELIWEKWPGEFEIISNQNGHHVLCRGHKKAGIWELVATRVRKKEGQEIRWNKIPNSRVPYMRPEPRGLAQQKGQGGVGERGNYVEVKTAAIHI